MINSTSETLSLSIVKEIAERMRDPVYVKQVILDSKNHQADLRFPELKQSFWLDLSLSDGFPGIVLMYSALDQLYPHENWDKINHNYVLKIKESIELHGISQLSLFGGLAGVCFALEQASKKGTRYQKLINTLNSFLIQEVEQKIFPIIKENLCNGKPSPMASYDLIQGISGIGMYGLSNLPLCLSFVEEITHLLVALTKPIKINDQWMPGWYVPPEDSYLQNDRKRFPKGNFNLGLAHGIPGILGFLSVALLKGMEVEGQREAIERVSKWLQQHRKKDHENYFWETLVSFDDEISRKENKNSFNGKDAWCYGTPGVARILFIAGKALNDNSLKKYALESFRSIFARTITQWNLPGPSFCHGMSGLLAMTWQMACDAGAEDLKIQSKLLEEQLLQFYDPNSFLGFQDFVPSKNGGYVKINRAGLLEGVSGILLTLLAANGLNSWWHAPLLIGDC